MKTETYTGGRQMNAVDYYELTEVDRAQIRYRELWEEKFLHETDDFKEGAKKAVTSLLLTILWGTVFCVIVLAAIMYTNAGQ